MRPAVTVVREQIHRQAILPDAHIRLREGPLDHRAHHLASRGVAQRMHDSRVRVAALARECDAAILLVEPRAPANQLGNPPGTSRTTIATTSGSHSPLPAARVSAMWSSKQSSGSSTPAIPPCA